MRFSNLHTHTSFSDGKATPRENIESAIKKDMSSLGFSDHSFTACDTSYCMKQEDYGAYCREINALKKEYEGKLPVFLGIEKDYYSEIDESQFDYVIASVHYIVKNGICYPIDHSAKQQLDCIKEAFDGNVLDMVKCYYEMLTEQAIKEKPDVIGHFDVINKFSLMPENDEKYIEIGVEALKETIKHCPRFELNTGGISRGWRKTPYPNLNLMYLIRDLGGEIVINSDSHSAENLDFYFKESLEIVKNAGFNSISEFDGQNFKKIYI